MYIGRPSYSDDKHIHHISNFFKSLEFFPLPFLPPPQLILKQQLICFLDHFIFSNFLFMDAYSIYFFLFLVCLLLLSMIISIFIHAE